MSSRTSRHRPPPSTLFPSRAHRQRSENSKWQSETATARLTRPDQDLSLLRIPPLLSNQTPTSRYVFAIEELLIDHDSNIATRTMPTTLRPHTDMPQPSQTWVHHSRLPITWVSTLSLNTTLWAALRSAIKHPAVWLSTCTWSGTPV